MELRCLAKICVHLGVWKTFLISKVKDLFLLIVAYIWQMMSMSDCELLMFKYITLILFKHCQL